MEEEFLGDPFANQSAEASQICQLCERRGHTAKNCPTIHGKKGDEEAPRDEETLQLWRVMSETKKFLITDDSGDVLLSNTTSPEGWEEWELTRTEQQSGNPILTLRNHKSGGYLYAYQGNKSKVVCMKNVGSDAPEIFFTLEMQQTKKLLHSSKTFRTLRTHHGTYLADKGKHVTCTNKKPEKEKHTHWHLYEVKVPAEVRQQLHLQAQEFHQPHDLDTRNPHLPHFSVDYDLTFRLAEKLFRMSGNADVTDPDGRVWFRVGPIGSRDVSLSGEHGRFGITNAKGEPLVFLQDMSRMGMLKYSIARIVKTDQGLKCVPRATIERKEHMLGATYEIFLWDGRTIPITGGISDLKTTFKDPITGDIACSISRKISISSGKYELNIRKGEDVMLYLAYAVTIDKMHHEASRGISTALSTYEYEMSYNSTTNYNRYGSSLWDQFVNRFNVTLPTKCNACELQISACRCYML